MALNQKQAGFSHGNHCTGSGSLPEITVTHRLLCHPQIQVKALAWICEHNPKALPCFLCHSSFKKVWAKVETVVRQIEIWKIWMVGLKYSTWCTVMQRCISLITNCWQHFSKPIHTSTYMPYSQWMLLHKKKLLLTQNAQYFSCFILWTLCFM